MVRSFTMDSSSTATASLNFLVLSWLPNTASWGRVRDIVLKPKPLYIWAYLLTCFGVEAYHPRRRDRGGERDEGEEVEGGETSVFRKLKVHNM